MASLSTDSAHDPLQLDFPRSWFDFYDPDDPAHLFSIDLTWLLSTYSCRFGTDACQGISELAPDVGCCVHGAFLSDEDDRHALADIASQLTSQDWQLHDQTLGTEFKDSSSAIPGRQWAPIEQGDSKDSVGIEPWLEWDELDDEEGNPQPALKTKTINNACVFANREGFPGGTGCALHGWALRNDVALEVAKPEVCWQLPLRREEEYKTLADGTEILVTRITEYTQRDWGTGGEDFQWYCTNNAACHAGSTGLWKSSETPLRVLLGDNAYEVVAEKCSAIEQASQKSQESPSGFPYISIHPATAAAHQN